MTTAGFQFGFADLEEDTEAGVGEALEDAWYFKLYDMQAKKYRKFSIQFTSEGFLLHVFHLNKNYFIEDGGGNLSFVTSVKRLVEADNAKS